MRAAKIPSKFSTLSRSMSIPPQHLVTFPKSSPSTASNYPARQTSIDHNLGTGLVVEHKPYLELSHFLQPPSWLSPLAIFFLWLSGAISPPGSPCSPLSVPCLQLSLQTQIVLTSPVTFKALPSGHTTTLCPVHQKNIFGRIESPPKQGQCRWLLSKAPKILLV